MFGIKKGIIFKAEKDEKKQNTELKEIVQIENENLTTDHHHLRYSDPTTNSSATLANLHHHQSRQTKNSLI